MNNGWETKFQAKYVVEGLHNLHHASNIDKEKFVYILTQSHEIGANEIELADSLKSQKYKLILVVDCDTLILNERQHLGVTLNSRDNIDRTQKSTKNNDLDSPYDSKEVN